MDAPSPLPNRRDKRRQQKQQAKSYGATVHEI